MRKTNKKLFLLKFIVTICLATFMSIWAVIVSAEEPVTVLYEFYNGEELPGFRVGSAGGGSKITTVPYEDGKIHTTMTVGDFYQDTLGERRWGFRWGGPVAYVYDPVNVPGYQSMSIIDFTDIASTAYIAMDVMIAPTGLTPVKTETYYIALGRDVGHDGNLINTKYVGVPLNKGEYSYYTDEDVGTMKTIYVPIGDFLILEGDPHNGRLIFLKSNKVPEVEGSEGAVAPAFDRACAIGVLCNSDVELDWDVENDVYISSIKVLSGFPTDFKTTFSTGGTTITNMTAGDITVETSFFGNEGAWIVAHFNSSNELIAIKALEKISAVDNTVTKNVTFNCDATDVIRVFFWKDIYNMEPLADYSELKPNQ